MDGAFPLGQEHNSPPSRCQPRRCWHHQLGWRDAAAPSTPLPREDESPPSDGISLALDMSSSPLLNQRTPDLLLAALLL